MIAPMKKCVRIRMSSPAVQADVSAPMGFWQFMLECIRFWRNHGTHLDDFDTMVVCFHKEDQKEVTAP